jgi:hypothetical protein
MEPPGPDVFALMGGNMKKHKKPGHHKTAKRKALLPKPGPNGAFLSTGNTKLKALCAECNAQSDIEPRELNRSFRPRCSACGSYCLEVKRVRI